MPALTRRQQEVLQFLQDRLENDGFMPTTREIQDHFGFASQTAAVNHLKALERRGAIHRLARKARAVALPSSRRTKVKELPIHGRIAAGFPDLASQEPEGFVAIDETFSGVGTDPRFALRVRGDSMIGAHIVDGDLVILQVREPRHGDIVAALVDGETTLKRFVLEDSQPMLRAENPKYPDLVPATQLVVQGVMVGLVRRQPGS
jgi:repressor LexA